MQPNISIISFHRLKLRLRLCACHSLEFLFLIKLLQYIGLDVKMKHVSVKNNQGPEMWNPLFCKLLWLQ